MNHAFNYECYSCNFRPANSHLKKFSVTLFLQVRNDAITRYYLNMYVSGFNYGDALGSAV